MPNSRPGTASADSMPSEPSTRPGDPRHQQGVTLPPIDARLPRSSRAATFDRTISIALLFVGAMMMVFYLTVGYRSQMHSDSSMKLLLGAEMARQWTLFPRDWYYINDIWIIFPSLIAAPLSLLLKPSMFLHGVVDVVAFACVSWAAYVAARAVGISGGLRWFVATMLATGLSLAFAEMVFAQSAYSAIVFTLLLLAGSGARFFAKIAIGNLQWRRRDMATVAGLLVVSVASGPRGIATYFAPMLFAAGGMWLIGARNNALRAGAIPMVVLVCGAAVVGGCAFLVLLHTVRYLSGAAMQVYATPEEIAAHLRLASMNWLMIFDALPPGGQRFSPLAGGIQAARMAVAAVLFALPIALVLRIRRLKSTPLQFLVLFQIGLLCTTGYMLIFTNLLVDTTWGVPRYVMPLVPVALLVFALWLQETAPALRLNATRIGWVPVLVMLSLSPRQLIGSGLAQWPHLDGGTRQNAHADLVTTLRGAGLHRGYAEYWDATILTILSGSDVEVAPILLDENGLPVPHRYLGAERWYTPSWAGDVSFLCVNSASPNHTNVTALAIAAGTPTRTLHTGIYDVLVFPTNLSASLAFTRERAEPHPAVSKALCATSAAAATPELELRPGQLGTFVVHATNTSELPWKRNYAPPFNPGLRIVDANGAIVADVRGMLSGDVPPGASTDIPIALRAPAQIGDYTLYFSFVAEGQAWCGDLGAGWAQARLTVAP